MASPDQPGWVASFEGHYPRLFTLLRDAGWLPDAVAPVRSQWATRAGRFSYNPAALALELELGSLELSSPLPGDNSRFTFAPGTAFDHMERAAGDYDEDVFEILDTLEAFPVGEGNGAVLFVSDTGRAALIDQSLSGFTRADDPFALIEGILLDANHPGVEVEAVAQGDRVTGRRSR